MIKEQKEDKENKLDIINITKFANEFVKSSNKQKLKLLEEVKIAVSKLYQHCNTDYLGLCFNNEKDKQQSEIYKQLSNYASWSYLNVANLKSFCEKLEKEFSKNLTDKMFCSKKNQYGE